MKNKEYFLVFVLSIFTLHSFPALAHSGHDHSSADAGLIHLLWLAPIIIAAGIFAYRELTNSRHDN